MKGYPGQVWFLPPEWEEGGDTKRRRHVLLTNCDEGEVGVFSYASTRATEARSGAMHLFVDPAASRDQNTGFAKPTYIYASRLVPALLFPPARLCGRMVDELPRFRWVLSHALGLGTGTDTGGGTAAGSWRGRVVELRARFGESIGYRYGIIVTEPDYSRRRRYQIVVPMDDSRSIEREPDDVVVSGCAWIQKVDPKFETMLLGVSDMQSAFHRVDISGWTGAVVDDDTITVVEQRLNKGLSRNR